MCIRDRSSAFPLTSVGVQVSFKPVQLAQSTRLLFCMCITLFTVRIVMSTVKWSLPWRYKSILHDRCGTRIGQQIDRSKAESQYLNGSSSLCLKIQAGYPPKLVTDFFIKNVLTRWRRQKFLSNYSRVVPPSLHLPNRAFRLRGEPSRTTARTKYNKMRPGVLWPPFATH